MAPTALPVDVELHPGQARVLREARRFNAWAAGRRCGKSVLSELLMVEVAGERRGRVAYIAPQYKLLAETWRDLDNDFGPAIAERSLTERRMKLVTGGVIEMWSAEDADAGRSRRYHRVIVDEAGLIPHLGEMWERALRPTLADFEGDAWFLGTPKGRNFFWQAYQRGQDAAYPDWASWRMPTSVNPWIKPEEIEAMRRGMTERSFRQEVEAEFLDDAGGVFRFVREAATAERQSAAHPGHAYVAGLDWGREGDFTVLAVIDLSTMEVCAIDRFTGVEYALQRARIGATWQAFGRCPIMAESNSIGAPNIEAMQRDGMMVTAFATTATSKGPLIDNLALLLEQRKLRIPADETVIGELEAYESERLPSGTIRYGAPEGMHDDTVIAIALAAHAARTHAGPWIMAPKRAS